MVRTLPLSATAAGLTMLLLMPVITTAQIDRSKAPEPGPAPQVRVGEHTSFVLDNGMRVIVVENHKLPTISVQMRFDIEPFLQGEAVGYTDLVGELLTSGTRRSTKAQIDERVDALGAQLSATADGLFASGLKKNFSPLMDLVYEVVSSASFPADEFDKAKTRMLSAMQSRKDDPDGIADQVGRALTFSKGHPYGEVATEKSVAAITRKQVAAYYGRFFIPANSYLVFVGDITQEEARQAGEKYFKMWAPNTDGVRNVGADGVETVEGLGPIRTQKKLPLAPTSRRVAFVDRPGAAQSLIRVVYPLHLHPWDPMQVDAQVLNTILGGGVFNARLMQNLREDKGYTYGAYSSLESDRYAGSFSAGASVRTAVTDSAVGEFVMELERMRENMVTKEELSLAKNYLAGSFARSLEDPRTIARFALNTYLYNLPPDHYNTYLQRLDTVSAMGVMAAARQFITPDHSTILVVGDKEKVASKLAQYSFEKSVGVYDINGDIYKEKVQPPPPGMTAQQVLDAYFVALGGKSKLMGVSNLRTVMTASVQGMTITATAYNKSPDKYAMEMKAGPMTVQKMVYDGVRGISTGPEGKKELIEMELEELAMEAPAFPELNYQRLGRLILSGLAEIDGEECYKVTLLLDNGGLVTEYYSTKSGLKLRKVQVKQTAEGNQTVTTELKDYRAEGGIQFPHLVEQSAGMSMTFTVTEIAVNKGVPDGVFLIE
ncbi:MAG: pitrilysin family protein [Flavobacteriales bacterium]